MDNRHLPELLAPAGSEESLRAALAAGADAVYFGSTDFSNRMRAKNFTKDSISSAIKLCHSVGAAAHITVNTRIRDRETDGLLSLLETLLGGKEDERADALIVADLGVARLIKERYPDAVLHASTQTSMISPADCEALRSIGFSRLVIPRESSLDEINSLVKKSPLEIEMFIHGAHCVSCSGQCLLSYVMGGRSGNRGECAQPCRLPYRMETSQSVSGGQYPLSMSDMCLAEHIPEIIRSGVASLKLEGRLKSAAYVYGVTSIYRTLLDENRPADKKEIKALESLFTRGFSDGYLVSDYSGMAGKKPTELQKDEKDVNQAVSRALSKRIDAHSKNAKTSGTPIKARIYLRNGEPSLLSLTAGDISVSAEGAIPVISTGNPLNEDSVAKNIMKLGGTGYTLEKENIEFDIGPGLWMPLSALNELRRNAILMLPEKEEQPEKATVIETERAKAEKKDILSPEKTAEIADLSVFLKAETGYGDFTDYFKTVYVQQKDVDKAISLSSAEKTGLMLPLFTPDDDSLKSLVKEAEEKGIKRIMCHTLGQLETVRSMGLYTHMSFRANITNSYAAETYESLGADAITLSPELITAQARDIAKSTSCSCGLIGYGRLPLMHLSRCLICGGNCKKGNAGGRISYSSPKPHTCTGSLSDRMGESFPVIAAQDCTNTIYNSAVTWMGDRYNDLKLSGNASFVHFIFSTESLSDAVSVMKAYSTGERREGRRI